MPLAVGQLAGFWAGGGGAPSWLTAAGRLGQVEAGAFASFQVEGRGRPATLDVDYPARGGALPRGFALDAATGVIAGAWIAGPELLGPPAGFLGRVAEGAAFLVPLTASAPATAALLRGTLPPGLRLDPVGLRIVGIVANALPPPVGDEDPLGPAWDDPPPGGLGLVAEGQAVAILFAATPRSPATAVRFIWRRGMGPPGARLNAATGLLSGTIANALPPPVGPAPGLGPVLSGADLTLADGAAVDLALAIAVGDAPVAFVGLVAGTPPAGLRLDPALRRLVGTVALVGRPSGTAYAWTIAVVDAGGRVGLADFTAIVT